MKSAITDNPAMPPAAGPYRQAAAGGGVVFVSGQIPVNPATGALVADDMRAATRQVLANIAAVLEGEGLSLADVVKTTVYLRDINDFDAMNAVYAEIFNAPYPARVCLQAAALPKGAMLEIEALAAAR